MNFRISSNVYRLSEQSQYIIHKQAKINCAGPLFGHKIRARKPRFNLDWKMYARRRETVCWHGLMA